MNTKKLKQTITQLFQNHLTLEQLEPSQPPQHQLYRVIKTDENILVSFNFENQ